MKCPKCGKNMNKDFCMFCGYMLNGNYIHKTNYEMNDLAKALGNNYDMVIRNENVITVLLLGPLYFAYRNYFFLGLILEIIDALSYVFIYVCGEVLRITPPIIPNIGFWLVFITYFILNKIFWISMCNPIYSFLVNKKIKKINKKYKNESKYDRENHIRSIKIRNIYKPVLAVIILIMIPIITVVIIRWYFGNL